MERYTYEITFTRLDGQPDEIQQHTSEELARECFRLFDEPDSAEMYSKIELSRHDWETGMDPRGTQQPLVRKRQLGGRDQGCR